MAGALDGPLRDVDTNDSPR